MKKHYPIKSIGFMIVLLMVAVVAGASYGEGQLKEAREWLARGALTQLKEAQDVYEGEYEGEPEGEAGNEGEAEGENQVPSEGEGESQGEGEREGEPEGEAGSEGEAEGEGECEDCFWGTVSWEYYAGVAAVVGLAYGILWLAEDPPSPCMVASAAYGTPMAVEITLLRRFRDVWLLESVVGTAFVDVYYRGGGLIASFVGQHAWAAQTVRLLLYPVLMVVVLALFIPTFFYAMMMGLLLLTAIVVVWWRSRRRRRSRFGPCLKM